MRGAIIAWHLCFRLHPELHFMHAYLLIPLPYIYLCVLYILFILHCHICMYLCVFVLVTSSLSLSAAISLPGCGACTHRVKKRFETARLFLSHLGLLGIGSVWVRRGEGCGT